MDRCVNCNIATDRSQTIGRRILDDEEILSVISKWRTPQLVTKENHVCLACWNLARDVVQQRLPLEPATRVGHSRVCLHCGRSLLTQRQTHRLRSDSARESAICNVIKQWIMPNTLDKDDHICHSCWIKADRAARRIRTGPSTSTQSIPWSSQSSHLNEDIPTVHPASQSPDVESNVSTNGLGQQPESSIVLPGYTRAIETERHCFIKGCRRSERYRVPLVTRQMLLQEYKYYVPPDNRLCDDHLVIPAWDFLPSIRSSYVESFTAKHIIDMLELKDPDT